ncbi:uncharacterized protein LOC143298059 [Babylonia areolata]|uniref:uncharacterized protein LOC143298059 n=1 Tax=Babylonia areolata TaxID=304850 RepID=UPI003FD25884
MNEVRGERQYTNVGSSFRDQNSSRWGASFTRQGPVESHGTGHSQFRPWDRGGKRKSGLDARERQRNPVTNRSQFCYGTYDQLYSSWVQRNGRNWPIPNTTGYFVEQDLFTKDRGYEGDTTTCGAYNPSETVPAHTKGFETSSQRREDQNMGFRDAAEPDHFLHEFSRLSLNTENPSRVNDLPNSDHKSRASFSRQESSHVCPADWPTQAADKKGETASLRDIRSFQNIVKCPSKEALQFSFADEFVRETIDMFQKAIDVSEGENTRALYDLARMYKAVCEFDKALKLLDIIQLPKHRSEGLFDKINAYELSGLILKDMSMRESDVRKKKRLAEEGESKLNTALRLCSRLCNKLPGLQHYIQHVWHAFPTLFQAAEQSDRHITDKLLEKARLFSMIKDNYRSMDLLQEIASIAPEKADDPDYLKMHIENYVALEQYDQALAFIETLTCTAQRTTMDYFEDPQYVQKVYMKAGKAALLQGTSQDALNKASSYFSAAFADACGGSPGESSSSEDTESADETFGDESWDMMLLHEESAKSKSEALADIFEKVFGLKVTGMFEDCLPGRWRQDSFLWVMKKSKLVVVLAGGHRLSGTLRLLMGKAAKRPSTVALLVDGNHVPQLIKSMTGGERLEHHMVCPEELLTEESQMTECGTFPPNLVQKACDVFSFLVNIPFT